MKQMAYHGKIFGIGLSRTGTTSLSTALELLGIRTKHFPWDDVTYRELASGSYNLSIMENFQAVTDTPVAPFYAQLDRAFPESKFILTVREKEEWLRSVRSHWKLIEQQCEGNERFRRFTDFIHASVYGCLAFDEERFSYVYDLHHDNVKSYFQGRENDLLVVDICSGGSWQPLCEFLCKPIPSVPFPHSNRSPESISKLWGTLDVLLPRNRTSIVVGLEQLGIDKDLERRVLPFLERHGQPWGLPADDCVAETELERMRGEGARYIAFTWPTFWWFDHYRRFHEYLRSRYACLLENKDVVVFDLG